MQVGRIEQLTETPYERYLTEKDAAHYLDVSESTLKTMRRQGEISYIAYKRKFKYAIEDLVDFLARNRVQGKIGK